MVAQVCSAREGWREPSRSWRHNASCRQELTGESNQQGECVWRSVSPGIHELVENCVLLRPPAPHNPSLGEDSLDYSLDVDADGANGNTKYA
jgi:hypothetical protein